MQLIPAIDLLDGKVVRLTQGDCSQVETYAKDPIELAQWYEELGAERIHLVDLDGAKNGSLTNISILKEIRKKTDCILEVGGGIRDKESASRLINLGINHLILGSLLIKNWALSCDMITENPNIFIAGIDV
jgi:phosphoribosylformimino-5-aminoimidazole carboxamide ribotide isomerase